MDGNRCECPKFTILIGDVPVKIENRVDRMEKGSFVAAMLHVDIYVDTLVQAGCMSTSCPG